MTQETPEYKHILRHRGILTLLERGKGSNKMYSPAEISKTLGLSLTVVQRDVKQLSDIGCIKKFQNPAGGNSYIYAYLSHNPTKAMVIKEKDKIAFVEFTSDSIQDLLARWSKEPWHPKIFITARNLPIGLAELYKLALDAKYGAAVKQIELNSIREKINEFRVDITNVLMVVNGLLAKPELWNTSKLPLFLLPDSDEDSIRKYVIELNEKN